MELGKRRVVYFNAYSIIMCMTMYYIHEQKPTLYVLFGTCTYMYILRITLFAYEKKREKFNFLFFSSNVSAYNKKKY